MSILHQTVLSVIEAYNLWDIEKIMAVRSPECIHEMLPNTLGLAPMDNAAYESWQKNTVIPMFRNLRIEVLDLVEDTKNNKVAVWAKSSAESPTGPYGSEYMLVFHMNEEGDKLIRLREFADSAYSHEFFAKLGKAMAEKPADE
ncbi:hypothetical protein B0T25DRAFT_237781 [Lasiosphaeria hispida]|uniref:SnoaL-like domain-containing protein n=1 Tax=Lasiosphaeria hispida TaxID=260671 RepID=A0AAJ0HEC2_9PEZI|nr:hypothetical protein B0T25DRAFT_237781 [Lasiosphaeria hispida]